jgi:hypothetical protein
MSNLLLSVSFSKLTATFKLSLHKIVIYPSYMSSITNSPLSEYNTLRFEEFFSAAYDLNKKIEKEFAN